MPPTCPAGTATGCRSRSRSTTHLGRKKLEMDPLAVREECRKYATKYLDLQRSQFKRLGGIGSLGEALLHHGSPVRERRVWRRFTSATRKAWSTRA